MRQRFLEWDYDNDRSTEFRRDGECTRCGRCCIGKHQFATYGKAKNGGPCTNGRGVWQEVRVGTRRRYYQMGVFENLDCRCSNLTEDNLCTRHSKQPGLCRYWPLSPSDLVLHPNCGFRFEIVASQKISDLKEAS